MLNHGRNKNNNIPPKKKKNLTNTYIFHTSRDQNGEIIEGLFKLRFCYCGIINIVIKKLVQ